MTIRRLVGNGSGLLRQNILARNTAWMTAGHGIRLFFQAIYFLFIARALGAASYGAFVGTVALVAIVAPFSTWGMGFILVKEVARSRQVFGTYWGAALTVTLVAGCLLLGFVAALSRLIWGSSIPFSLVLLVGIADIIVVRIVDLAAQAFAAIELLKKSAEVYVILSVARAVSAGYLLFFWRTHSLTAWGWLYLLSAIVASLYSVFLVTKLCAVPRLGIRALRGQFTEGFYFAVSQASLTLHNDIDKTMLVRFAALDATGIYGAAYRIVDVCFAPVSALVYSTLARFFRYGKTGLSETIRFANRLTVYSAVYGAVAALGLFFGAPLLPRIVGHDFANSVIALRWLSPIIVIRTVHYFLANSLSGAGYQGSRTLAQLTVVGVNILLNLWLMPMYSWRGAAWASLASDTALVLALVLVLRYWVKRSATSNITTGIQVEAM